MKKQTPETHAQASEHRDNVVWDGLEKSQWRTGPTGAELWWTVELLPLSRGLFDVAPGTAYLGAEPHICVPHGAPSPHKSPAEDLWKDSSNI